MVVFFQRFLRMRGSEICCLLICLYLLPSTEGWHSTETAVRVNILRRVSLRIVYLQIMYLFNRYLLGTYFVLNIMSNKEQNHQPVRY